MGIINNIIFLSTEYLVYQNLLYNCRACSVQGSLCGRKYTGAVAGAFAGADTVLSAVCIVLPTTGED